MGQSCLPCVDPLEVRCLLSTVHWTGLAGGGDLNWSSPNNWDSKAVPQSGDSLVFDIKATNPSATVDSGFTHAVASVVLDPNWGGTLTIASPLSVTGAMSQGGGTVTGSSNLTVHGLLTWTNGTMSGSGTTTAAGGLVLGSTTDDLNIETLDDRTFNNAGAATWIGAGFLDPSGSHSHFFNQLNGSVFNNQSKASLTIENDIHWFSNVQYQYGYLDRPYPTADSSTFVNSGTITKSAGAGTTFIDVALTGNGAINVQQGTLTLFGGGNLAGSTSVASGATFGLSDYSNSPTFTFASTSSLSGAGNVNFGGNETTNVGGTFDTTGGVDIATATVNFVAGSSVKPKGPVTIVDVGAVAFDSGSPVTLPSLTMNAGYNGAPTLKGSDDVTVNSLFSWNSGSISGTGTLTTLGGMAVQLGGLTLDQKTLNLASDTTLTRNDGSAAGLALSKDAVINNESGRTFDVQVDWGSGITAGGTFNNQGTLKKSAGAGLFSIGGIFNNTGSVLAQSGSLHPGDTGAVSGLETVASGATLVLGGQTFTSASSITGAGTVTFVGGPISTTIAGTYNITGATIIKSFTNAIGENGDVVEFTGSVASLVGRTNSLLVLSGRPHFNTALPGIGDDPIFQGGEADFNSGTPISVGTLHLKNATLGGSDSWSVTSLMNVQDGFFKGTGQLLSTGQMTLIGTYIQGWTIRNAGHMDDYANLTINNGVFDNLKGATIRLNDNANVNGPNGGVLNNDGFIVVPAGSPGASLFLILNDTGTVEVDSGTLQFGGGGDFEGTLVVQTGSALQVSAYYAEVTLGPKSDVVGGGTILLDGSLSIGGEYHLTGPTMADPSGSGFYFHPSLTLDSDVTLLGSLGLINLQVNSNVNVRGTLSLTSPVITGSGTLNAFSGLAIQGALSLSGSVALKNDGQATWDGKSQWNLHGTSTFTNEAGATFSITGGDTRQSIYGETPYGQTADAGVFWNKGTMVVSAGTSDATFGASVINSGQILVQTGTLHAPGFVVDGSGIVTGAGTLLVAGTWGASIGEFTGSTTNAALFAPPASVQIVPAFETVPSIPFEVMSRDLGATSAGFVRNFAYNQLTIQVTASPNNEPPINTIVRLGDNSKNSGATTPEALYVDSLTLLGPATGSDPGFVGGTLDMNGLHVYTRAAKIDPSVQIINGSILIVPDGGALPLGSPVSGKISASGETDDWTFYGKSGQLFAATLNTGASSANPPQVPTLDFGQVRLVDPSGNVVGTASNSQAGNAVSLLGIHLPADGVYHVIVSAGPSHATGTGNYELTVWDTTPHNGPLNVDQNASGALATPFSTDTWTFAASAGTQVQFRLISSGTGGIGFDLNGPGGYSGFSNLSSDSDLLTLPSDGTYTITVHSAAGKTGAYSFRLDEPNPILLNLAAPFSGKFAGNSQSQLFKLTLDKTSPLTISLKDASASDHNELYLRFGVPPTRAVYQYAASNLGSSSPTILIPSEAPGDLYILVFAEAVSSASTYTLLATVSDEVINTISPSQLGNGLDMSVKITGAGFDALAAVSLVAADGTTTYAANSVQVDGSTQLTAGFKAGTVPPGAYAVRVVRADGLSATLPAALTVVAGGIPHLETHLVVPFPIGYHLPSTFYVEYSNTGTGAMPAPILNLTGIMNGQQGAFLSLDLASANWSGNNGALREAYATTPAGFSQSVQILASGAIPGQLQPQESVTIPVYYGGWLSGQWDLSRPPIDFNLTVATTKSTTTINWNPVEDKLRPPGISAAAWNTVFTNLVAEFGSNEGSYIQRLDDTAAYLGHLGEAVTDVSRLWAFNVADAIGFVPVGTMASVTDASVTASHFLLDFSRSFGSTIVDRNRLGRMGYGWSDNWDTSLSLDANGNATVNGPGGGRRTFMKLAQGDFLAQPGDHGTLTLLGDGSYVLLEKTGERTAFKSDGTLDFIADANGNKITAGYTGSLLTSLSESAGVSLSIHYNTDALIDSVTDSNGRKATYSYNAMELVAVTEFDGLTTHFGYDVTGSPSATEHALTSISYPDGSVRHFGYDAHGRLIDTHLNTAINDVTYGYDLFGMVTVKDAAQQQDPASLGSRIFFDERGLPVKTEDQFHTSVSLAYDANFNLTRVTSGDGLSSRFSYDQHGNLVSSSDPLNDMVRYTYSSSTALSGTTVIGTFDRLSGATDANGNTTRYQSDPSGNLRTVTFVDGSTRSFSYDPLGNPLSFTNQNGITTQNTLDASGRVTSSSFADGSKSDYAYDLHGDLVSATDANGKITLAYDSADRLTSVSYPTSRSLTFTYDAFGRRTQMTDQDHVTVHYRYDEVSRLVGLTDGQNQTIVSYTYDPVGRLSRKDLGNGTFTTYAFDGSGQLISLFNHAPDGSANSRFDYTYDDLGRRLTTTGPGGTERYGYDGAGRLISDDYPGGHTQYKYDAVGNRSAVTDGKGTTTYTVNSLNETTAAGGKSFVYDKDGNLVSQSDGTTTSTFQYDSSDRLVGFTDATGTSSYQYDALGDLSSSKDSTGAQTSFLVDPMGIHNVVGQYQGSSTTNYTYGLGLVNQVSGSATSYYDFDAVGSTVGLSNTSGKYANTYSYTPFGEVVSSSGAVANPFTYIGQFGLMSQSNGLDFMRARFYSPTLGLFLGNDPLNPAAGATSLHAYAGNDPVNHFDPTGLATTSIGGTFSIGAGAGFSISSAFVWDKTSFLPDLQTTFAGGVEAGVGFSLTGGATLTNADSTSDLTGFTPLQVGGSGGEVIVGGYDVTFGNGYQGITSSYGFGAGTPGEAHAFSSYTVSLKDVLNFAVGRFAATAEIVGGLLPNPFPYLPYPSTDPLGSDTGPGGSSSATASGGSQDPNDKIGPASFGSGGFVSPGQPFSYRVDFENDPSATAPAQVVTVTDQLDSNLDWNTFLLTDVGFGSTELVIPSGTRHYQTTASMTYNNQTFNVLIELGIHSDTGQIYATFQSLVASTNLPPDILTGFLPPEDGTGRGMGHFSYLVSPKTGLPTGTQIRNVASIIFDDNLPLATDLVDDHDPSKGIDPTKQVLRTIDVGRPTSSVSALNAKVGPKFTVNWSGKDDTGGSGVGTYTIYASDNGGPFQPWQTNTAATSATFTGVVGHTYSFYGVATDNVGNTELKTPIVEASTTVQALAATSTSLVSDHPAGSIYGQMVTFTSRVSTTSPGSPSGTIQFVLDGTTWGSSVALLNGSATSPALNSLAAGNHTITAVYSGDAAFSDSTSPQQTQSVSRANLTITADNKSKVYGGTSPTLTMTYVGFVNGEGTASFGSPASISTGASAASHVGRYPITVSGATSPNYTITFVPGTLEVTPAALTIAADDNQMTAGASLPTLTATYSGFVNGDSPTSLAAQTVFSTSASSASSPGSYPIIPNGASSPDYAVTFRPGTLKVIANPVVVTTIQNVQTILKKGAISAIVVKFSGAVTGSTNLAVYQLTSGAKGKHGVVKYTKAVGLKSATYNPTTQSVTLTLKKTSPKSTKFQLRIPSGLILDASQRAIDGDHNGQPAGDFTALISNSLATISEAKRQGISSPSPLAIDSLLSADFRL